MKGNMSNLPLKQVQQFYDDAATKSTTLSSNGSNDFQSEMDDLEMTSGMAFDASPVMQKAYSAVTPTVKGMNASLTPMAKTVKMENGWKKKVKTELCRFWLNGQACENSQKEQGCGFAHGQEELQKKKGLSRQYLTSVCKNFLEHPSKCTYGQRCIFQHPTFDVRKRQRYVDMMQDNARYTAMRLF